MILICVILGDDYNRVFDSARIILPRCDNELSEAKEKSHDENRRTPVLICVILGDDYNRVFDSARIIFPRCDNELSEAKEKSHIENRRTPNFDLCYFRG